ncbi:SDR family oxidoreductase [Kutzneria buriramensis]|uniref:NAD(P)-dependent dehydrogenase (Short-subunit alcohol dehydrogenase family) n=1 Tax=Kutzneria buriramensis TaxID=1045776 RepID=A0A3E0HYN4_9PSEU|nr:SDR family oxidoreductase [Kutzneria buriramensis]REH51584.1 NAD(P)-dependent dehydrogenase (short-subunit alcohol dehydrogenase family) [Kutzneria buriramensis]
MTDNTIALITGANKGIGREIAAQLVARGVTVLLAGRNPELVEAAANELGARPVVLDVTDDASVAAAAKLVEEEHGRLDVLVNNAGITGGRGNNDVATVQKVFNTNVFGVIRVTDTFLPLLLRSSAPRIVNVSSSVGSLAHMASPDDPSPFFSLTYRPSKTALNAITVQYAKELGKQGVKVNAVCPGWCATDLNGFAGHRTPQQGAEIAVTMATIGEDGPNGGFFDENGPVAW